MQTNAQLHWMYAFNHEMHPLCVKLLKEHEEKKKAERESKSNKCENRNFKILMSEDQKLKLISDIKDIIKYDKDARNSDMYRDMIEEGMMPGNGEHYISINTFSNYVTLARVEVYPEYRDISRQIIDLKKKDKYISEESIAIRLNTTKKYVRQILRKEGLISGRVYKVRRK